MCVYLYLLLFLLFSLLSDSVYLALDILYMMILASCNTIIKLHSFIIIICLQDKINQRWTDVDRCLSLSLCLKHVAAQMSDLFLGDIISD